MKKLTRKEKILLCSTVVGVGVAGYLGYKYINSERVLKISNQDKEEIKEELKFLKFLVIESGSIPKAKQNGENKLAREESQMKMLLETMINSPNNRELKVAYSKHESKHASISYELDKLYKLEELISNDEDIYAK